MNRIPNSCSIKSTLITVYLVFSAFSLNAQATLTNYNVNNTDLVYSSESGVTWTKDANLLGSMIASDSSVISKIVANSSNIFGSSGSYIVSGSDFTSHGSATWWGANAFISYLNSISYAGSHQWRLPTVATTNSGFNVPSNGVTTGNEFPELFYEELKGAAGSNIPNTPIFNNLHAGPYWTSTEVSESTSEAWVFQTFDGDQWSWSKGSYYHVWAVSPGKVLPVISVPESDCILMLLAGLGLIVNIQYRRK